MDRLTREEFIAEMRSHGVYISRITPKYVYTQTPAETGTLPNLHGILAIFREWKTTVYLSEDPMSGRNKPKIVNLVDVILSGKKIQAIKIVRGYEDLGLREAKDLVYGNWDAWSKLLIDELPPEELPLMLTKDVGNEISRNRIQERLKDA